LVGVFVGVLVGVLVGVFVGVFVGVLVGVLVGVFLSATQVQQVEPHSLLVEEDAHFTFLQEPVDTFWVHVPPAALLRMSCCFSMLPMVINVVTAITASTTIGIT
jgi:ABC-type antimicrobial peptide transport system permease subunit